MSKIRVYELAKELTDSNQKVASKDIVEKARELGIPVENHLSQLDETEAVRLKKAITSAQASASGKVTRVRRSVVRRRRGADSDAADTGAAPDIEATADDSEGDQVAAASEEPEAPEVVEPADAEAPVEGKAETEAPEPEPQGSAVQEAAAPEVEEVAADAPEVEPALAEAVVEQAPDEAETASAAEETAAVVPAEKVAEACATAVPGPKVRVPLTPTRRKKLKEGFKAVVVSMPEPPDPALKVAARPLGPPSVRQIEKEEKDSRPRKKGKKLIYDRRREPGSRRGGIGRSGKTRRQKAARKKGELEMPPITSQTRNIQIEETITVSDLASQMAVKVNMLMRKLVEQGIMVTTNDTLDYDTAAIIATDLGYEVENVAFDVTKYLDAEEDDADDLVSRPPVVTIMGHVDHGKTSLLDRIQKSDIASGEAGGITQAIGAYVVQVEKGMVVFVDTPGHEAFTAMRARGAQVTDLVVLVVAADDGVMPQTVEALNHAKAAGVPIIVAVNKTDRPEADPAKVRRELSDYELVPEEWGGSTIFIDVSAKTGDGIEALLEMLVLQSELLELKANPNKRAKGIVIESSLERGRGSVASVVVQEGTLRVGDVVVAGTAMGRVRALLDDKGKNVKEVGPSFPVEIIGLNGVPPASEALYAVSDEKSAKLVADYFEKKEREERLAKVRKPTFEQLFSQMGEDEAKVLKVVLKADSQGAAEAIRQGLVALSTEKVKLEVIHEGVGVISENDVNLAVTSDGLILGFNVKPDPKAKGVADGSNVTILSFSLIHELLDATHALMEGKLEMKEVEVYLGKAEVRQVFSISRIGKIAGCYMLEGKVLRSAVVRLRRGDELIHTGRLSSLKRFKDDVKEVAQGFECGMSVDNFNDIQEGDVIEAYEIQKIAATL